MRNKESKKIRQCIRLTLIVGLVAVWVSLPFLTNAASGGGSWMAMVVSSPTPTGSPTGSPNGTPTGSPTASPTGSPNEVVFFANLTGPAINGVTPTGFAQFEVHDSRIELEVRVNNVNLANGTAMQVDVDGALAGTMFLNDREARLRLRSDEGHIVPPVHAGSTIVVRTGATVRLSGTFAAVFGTPTPTPFGTPTGTPFGTPTGTPFNTPTPSPTATPNASPTATPNASPTATPFGTPTASPSPTGTPGVFIVRVAILRAPNGGVNPHGHAEWELEGNQRELEIEVENLSLPVGTVLTAFVDGNNVGNLIVDSNQRAELRLRTQDGQIVPFVNDGSTVHVLSGASVVVEGVFGNAGATPTPTGTPFGTPTPQPTATPTGTPNPSPSPTGTPGEFELFAALTGPTLNGVVPRGFAEFEVHDSRTELEVRVRQVNLPVGTTLTVIVDGAAAGNMTVRSGGEAELRLRSDNGQNVPPIVVGSTIAVNNGGTAILTGTFGNGSTPSPSPTGTPFGTPTPSPSPTQTPGGRRFEAHLTGSRVTPPVNTPANGEIKVTLSTDGTQATVFGEFHGLMSNQTGARVETTVGTVVTVFDLGVVGGRNGNFAARTFAITPAHAEQLRAGLLSTVITSVDNPAGEIRGMLRQHSRESDFDGDGSHDISVFRPSTGMWYMQNTNGFGAQFFGTSIDKVVSGDYDGDGVTDAAVVREANGQDVWYVQRSSDGGLTAVSFGLAGDIPVRGDFDGDGRLDIAVYRPSNGTWYVQRSDNTGLESTRFGVAEDVPMPADMDGDGRDDIVVFRPSLGNWYWLRSTDGQFAAVNFGLPEDVPVRGDFDGDGKADPTVYRPSTGVWYTLRSSDGGFQATQFGVSEDIPVAGNYDSDGKTDIAVFRSSLGNWYILRSSDGTFQAMQFGLNGDRPLIAR